MTRTHGLVSSSRVAAFARRHFVILALLGVFASGGAGIGASAARAEEPASSESAPAEPDTMTASSQVTAFYFHTTYRCASCRKLEEWTKEAIDLGFPSERESGQLLWKVVNVEEKGNEHFVKDYQLFTKSVILVRAAPGKPGSWKNLAKVWQLLGNKEEFLRYVRTETRDYLTPEKP